MSALELEDQVLDADASGNKSRVDALLLGAIKNLKSNKAKPDQLMIMNLMYLAKSRPEYFLSNRIVEVGMIDLFQPFFKYLIVKLYSWFNISFFFFCELIKVQLSHICIYVQTTCYLNNFLKHLANHDFDNPINASWC